MLDVSEQELSRWRVMKIGAAKGSSGYVEQWRHMYERFKSLPLQTQVAVAVLSMCADGEKLPGVGQKISPTSYWVDDTPEILKEYGDVFQPL